MHARASRAVSEVVVAAGTAGAIATAYWLLQHFLPTDDEQRQPMDTIAARGSCRSDETRDVDDSFAALPIVSEAESGDANDDARDYTADCYTPHDDVCVFAVRVQTQVKALSEAATDRLSIGCRLCDAEADDLETASELSMADTASSSADSAAYLSSGYNSEQEDVRLGPSFGTEQWLYVRL
ncbi:unnamed protein product [Hyaloperonospora brassicae]|uniref:RxLR effector candidate protein n=1 Tax=Hyaloperonospora brassicae TaxID=162125 RepID=A0AAV0U4I9_HYABA|nr:unnamed protein product [Hyaloperonospora brassicae]